MKLLILPILFNILFVDNKTNEPLTGVKVETQTKVYYSDFEGHVTIPNDEKVLKISYISYSDIKADSIKSDTLIRLNQL